MPRIQLGMFLLFAPIVSLGAIVSLGVEDPEEKPPKGGVIARRFVYQGWTNAVHISNGQVEAVIVPQIGRIMEFRFLDGNGIGPFWQNRALSGKSPDPQSREWQNFGGDKSWPAPQSDWPAQAGRGWPPPPGFDAVPVRATTSAGGAVTLTSGVDSAYGIRTRRRIELDSVKPKMLVITEYEKVEGDPVKVAVWTITQLRNPEAVFFPVPARSLYAEGYHQQSAGLPLGLKVDKGLVSLRRDPAANHKIGSDAEVLLWVGATETLTIGIQRVLGVPYPDQGSSAEVYTNSDPLDYVELELLGPLQTLARGQRTQVETVFELRHRTESDPEREAARILLSGSNR